MKFAYVLRSAIQYMPPAEFADLRDMNGDSNSCSLRTTANIGNTRLSTEGQIFEKYYDNFMILSHDKVMITNNFRLR